MAIRQKTTIKVCISGEGKSHSRTGIDGRDTSMIIDEPLERGGTNLGPSPAETGISALIACTHVIGEKCAAKLDIDVGTLSVDAVADFDRPGVLLTEEIETTFPAITLTVTTSKPVAEQDLALVAAETAKLCPLAKLFKNSGTELTGIRQSA